MSQVNTMLLEQYKTSPYTDQQYIQFLDVHHSVAITPLLDGFKTLRELIECTDITVVDFLTSLHLLGEQPQRDIYMSIEDRIMNDYPEE